MRRNAWSRPSALLRKAQGIGAAPTAGSCPDAADQPSGDTAMNQAAMQDFGKLVLRIALGALILLHGISKLQTGLVPLEGMIVSSGLPVRFANGTRIGAGLAG